MGGQRLTLTACSKARFLVSAWQAVAGVHVFRSSRSYQKLALPQHQKHSRKTLKPTTVHDSSTVTKAMLGRVAGSLRFDSKMLHTSQAFGQWVGSGSSQAQAFSWLDEFNVDVVSLASCGWQAGGRGSSQICMLCLGCKGCHLWQKVVCSLRTAERGATLRLSNAFLLGKE